MRVWDDDEWLAQCYVEWLWWDAVYWSLWGLAVLVETYHTDRNAQCEAETYYEEGIWGWRRPSQIPRMMMTKVVLPEMRVEAQQRRLHQRSVRC